MKTDGDKSGKVQKKGISLLNHVPTVRNNIIIHKIIPENVTKVDNRPKKGQPLTTKGKARITSQVRVPQKLDELSLRGVEN